jgi:hypothetical protein
MKKKSSHHMQKIGQQNKEIQQLKAKTKNGKNIKTKSPRFTFSSKALKRLLSIQRKKIQR